MRYTQGFNKRVRINLASALPLGFTSEAEIFDFWMNEVVEPVIISDRLTRSLPLEIELLGVELVDNSLPSLQASLRASDYEIVFPDTAQTESLEKDFLQLLSKDRIEITRRNKTIDIKPMIINHEFTQSNDGKSS